MKKYFDYFRNAIKGIPPLIALLIFITILISAIMAICQYRKSFVSIFIILGFLIWSVNNSKNERKIQEASQLELQKKQDFSIVFECMFNILSNVHKRLNTQQPVNINEIIPANPIILRGDAYTFNCIALKNDSKPFDESELQVFKTILQNKVNALCTTNSIGNVIPIYIVDITDSKTYLLIEVAVINNNAIYNFIENREYIKKQLKETQINPSKNSKQQIYKQIPLAYNKDLLDEGVNKKNSIVRIPINQLIHCLVFGSTGSGKTTYIKLLIYTLLKNYENAELWVLDYKNDDFKFLEGYSRYYKFNDCLQGLEEFYDILKDRQSGVDKSRNPKILLIDEFAAFITSIPDKKTADAVKSKVNELLMLGRSFQLKLICGAQRGDSTYFGNGGCRDNFQLIVSLGVLSKESRDMFFSDFKEKILPDRTTGTGYMLIGGSKFVSIQIPNINDMQRLEMEIKLAVDKQPPPDPAVED